jgi:hypothetical protein
MRIHKIGNGLYFKGLLAIRNNNNNMNNIDFPTIFEAKGKAIRNGNWIRCTAINTPQYVIDNYLEGNIDDFMPKLTIDEKKHFWDTIKQLEKLCCVGMPKIINPLIEVANNYIEKCDELVW